MNKIEDEIHVVVFVVGANDIGTKTPVRVLRTSWHSVKGARNRFNGNGYRQDFLEHWNYDAGVVNKLLREFASKVPWVRVIEHPEFHTIFRAAEFERSHIEREVMGSKTANIRMF
ncbi:hypothetical protein DPMN_167738 [Dreissena polymorpha]|uniref:Uncharacterized protein n=1 Tax=Dreissena polymorpha TaxID=45954 RepID=A0A9D4F1B2_DREPO|nr:hypothetical protein DPMN_167738 [Dreissena polymorpha]